ncbi:TPA: Lar family restriction alleviation protein [Salmonella enterica subsp. enterica serovar Muenchen]
MQKINYVVTFTGKYPYGCRHPLIVETTATGVSHAISVASEAIKDDRVEATDIELLSVLPKGYPLANEDQNSDGLLRPCPFCGNPYVSLIEVYPEFFGEIAYVVNCGCCDTTQHPDCKEGAIRRWNQREEEDKA